MEHYHLTIGDFILQTIYPSHGLGGHFNIASDMDVRQIRVRFLTLKSAKGVFLVSNFRKIIIFFNQITEILRIFFNNAKIYS